MKRRWKTILLSLIAAVGLTVGFGLASSPAGRRATGRQTSAKQWTPWSVETAGSRPFFPPVCRSLDYFSGSPRRFDYYSSLSGTTFTYSTKARFIGSVGPERIYQVVQHVDISKMKNTPGPLFEGMLVKRILVERHPDESCLIYQEQYGPQPSDLFPPITAATLTTVAGQRALHTRDWTEGNGGFSNEEAWTFDKSVPIPLLWSFNKLLGAAFRRLLPDHYSVMRGCCPGFDLQALSYNMSVWKPGDNDVSPTGGSVDIEFAVKDHRLVIVRQRYTP